MGLNVEKEVARMRRMTVNELREKFAEVFGEETCGRNKPWLIKRIAWRIQANAEDDLSERALRRAAQLANDANLRVSAPREAPPASTMGESAVTRAASFNDDSRLPMPGTLLKREYKGKTLQVSVLHDGFEFEGELYKSLSAIAKVITGSHWNGFLFFGLQKKKVAQ